MLDKLCLNWLFSHVSIPNKKNFIFKSDNRGDTLHYGI